MMSVAFAGIVPMDARMGCKSRSVRGTVSRAMTVRSVKPARAHAWMTMDASSSSSSSSSEPGSSPQQKVSQPAPTASGSPVGAETGGESVPKSAGAAAVEPELDVTPEALERDFVFSKGAAAIVAAYLPAFVLLLRNVLLKSRQPGVGTLRPVMAIALLLLNPDLASSAAIELTNAKSALQKASKRKALLRRVKPIIDSYKTVVVITCLMSALGMSYAALNFVSLRKMALGAFVVVLGQNMFHALARVKILRDGSLRETSVNERIPVLSLNGIAMILLLLVARGIEKFTLPAVAMFATIVFMYVVIKKTLQLVERLILS